MQQQTKAYLFATMAILFWSTVASAFKLTLKHIAPLPLIFYSCIFSFLVLLLIVVVQGKLREMLALPVKHWLGAIGFGLLNPALYYYVLFNAYDKLPAQQAMTINYSWPVMLVLLAVVLMKQRIAALEIVAIGIAYLGVVLIATDGSFTGFHATDPLGMAFAVLSTMIWSGYWLLNLRVKIDAVVNLCIGFFGAIPFLFSLIYFSPQYPDFPMPNMKALLGAAYIGVFEMGLTFVLWSYALKLSETTAKISGLIFLTPFFSLLFIAAFVGERIEATTIMGLLVVLCGIFLQKLAHRRSEKAKL